MPRRNFAKMFNKFTHKTRMIGLSCGEEIATIMLSRFDTIAERDVGLRAVRCMDRQNSYAISITREYNITE